MILHGIVDSSSVWSRYLLLLISLHHLTTIWILHANIRHMWVVYRLTLPFLLLLLLKSLMALDCVVNNLLQVFNTTVFKVTPDCDLVR